MKNYKPIFGILLVLAIILFAKPAKINNIYIQITLLTLCVVIIYFMIKQKYFSGGNLKKTLPITVVTFGILSLIYYLFLK